MQQSYTAIVRRVKSGNALELVVNTGLGVYIDLCGTIHNMSVSNMETDEGVRAHQFLITLVAENNGSVLLINRGKSESGEDWMFDVYIDRNNVMVSLRDEMIKAGRAN